MYELGISSIHQMTSEYRLANKNGTFVLQRLAVTRSENSYTEDWIDCETVNL